MGTKGRKSAGRLLDYDDWYIDHTVFEMLEAHGAHIPWIDLPHTVMLKYRGSIPVMHVQARRQWTLLL